MFKVLKCMVKGENRIKLCMEAGENICDRNTVTKLPALREVIKWFKGSFAIGVYVSIRL